MRNKKQVRNLLVDALDLLKRGRRWVQGSYKTEVDGVPCFCAIGALCEAKLKFKSKGGEISTEASNVLRQFVPTQFDGDIIMFNDNHATKYSDVAKMFRKAIKFMDVA
jgi:hypothetical protein